MTFTKDNNTLIITLSGRVDTSNADKVYDEIMKIVNQNTFEYLVIDAEKLEYISSAGLRIMLRIKKQYFNFKIINASLEVYEIFDMTGFTEMMDIEKAYRRISVEGCEVIGHGANGEVYRINDDTIVKVYKNPDSLDDIKREREFAKKAFILGIPTAISYEVAKVGEGYGSVFELLNAKSLAKLIIEDPDGLDKYVDMYVDLLKKIHSTEVFDDTYPSLKDYLIECANFDKDYLPNDLGEKLIKMINDIPEDKHLIHGDYHVKNVMVQNGEVLLIDMDTLCVGNPVMEFGPIFNAYLGYSIVDHADTVRFLGIERTICEDIWNKTIEKYFTNCTKEQLELIKKKCSITGVIRLVKRSINKYGVSSDVAMAQKELLIDLLKEVDDLII